MANQVAPISVEAGSEEEHDDFMHWGGGGDPHELLDKSEILSDMALLGEEKMNMFKQKYERQFASDFELLGNAFQRQGHAEITRIAHKMRSASGALGFEQLRLLLEQVESGQRRDSPVLQEIEISNRQSLEAFSRLTTSVTDSQNI